jgi:flagellar basal body-associated protein FliL
MKTNKVSELGGFINKKVVISIFAVIVIALAGYGIAKVVFYLRNGSGTTVQQNQVNSNPTNAAIPTNNTNTPAKAVVNPATLAQQCAICKSMIKAGAKSSCMTDLKCK